METDLSGGVGGHCGYGPQTSWCLETGLYCVLLGFSLASEACTETLVPMVDVNSDCHTRSNSGEPPSPPGLSLGCSLSPGSCRFVSHTARPTTCHPSLSLLSSCSPLSHLPCLSQATACVPKCHTPACSPRRRLLLWDGDTGGPLHHWDGHRSLLSTGYASQPWEEKEVGTHVTEGVWCAGMALGAVSAGSGNCSGAHRGFGPSP